MNSPKTSTRIGNAEREEAQRALQEHLNAGRLQVNEYTERSAAASVATTAAEIAVLFTDLPAPRPKLPGSSAGGVLRNPVVIGVAVLALAALALVVGFGARSDPPPAPVTLPTAQPRPAVAPTTSAVRPTPVATPTATPGTGGSANDVEVRRTTGTDVITLRSSYGVDLDNKTSPNWAVADTGTSYGRDIASINGGGVLYFGDDYAVVTGTPEYATCARETGYARGGIERDNLEAGNTICVKTDENRYALVTIVAADEQTIQFRAAVWEPAIPS